MAHNKLYLANVLKPDVLYFNFFLLQLLGTKVLFQHKGGFNNNLWVQLRITGGGQR